MVKTLIAVSSPNLTDHLETTDPEVAARAAKHLFPMACEDIEPGSTIVDLGGGWFFIPDVWVNPAICIRG